MDKTQIKVLLVEDNPVDIVLLREALEQDALNSFDLTSVERLQSAAETLAENVFDIILLDIGLPDSQGLKTFTHLHQFVPETPIIILSGLSDESLALQVVHKGAQDYIVKGTAGFAAAARAIRYAIERQQAHRALRVSEARYHQVLDAMLEGCQIIGFDWRYIYINAAAETQNRRPKQEFLGKRYMDMWPGIEATELFAVIHRSLEERVAIQMENEFTFPDGAMGCFNLSIQPVPEGVFILSTDITESKHARDALRASEERFRAMIENGLDDISLLDIHGNLLWESPAVVRNLGYPENAFVGQNIFNIVHPEDKVWMSALYARLIEVPGSRQNGIFRLQRSDGTWRWVEAIVTNMLDNPSVQALVVNYRDITERKQAEENYQAVFERAVEGIFQSSPEGRYINVNPAMAHIYGYASPQEMLESINDISRQIYLEPQDRAEFTRLMDTENSVRNFEMKNRRKDGSIIWISATARAVLADDGKPLYYEGFLQDITERKQAEEKLHASEERYRQLVDNFPNGTVTVYNRDLQLAFVAGSDLKKFNAQPHDFLGKEFQEITPPETFAIAEPFLRAAFQGQGGTYEAPYWDDRYYYVNVAPIHEPDGQIHEIMLISQNISERKHAEQALQRSEEYFRALIENGSDIITVLDTAGTIQYESPALERALGYRPEELVGRNAFELIHPDDLPHVIDVFTRVFPTMGAVSKAVEMRFLHKDGLWRVLEAIGQSLVDQSGKLIGVINSRDITERKQAMEKVHTAHEFLQGIQNALSAHIAILNADGEVIQVNAAWREFADQNGLAHTNYGIGLNYLDICDSATGADADEAQPVARAVREILAGKMEQAQIEYPCHSPAEQRWFLLQITSFKDGDKRSVVLAHENITERKLAEEAVQETSEQFRTLFEASPEAIMIIDPHGDWPILDCNATGCAMNGYTRAELIGQSVDVFNLTPGNPTERSEYLERVRKADTLRYETSHRRKDGTVFPVEVSTSLIILGGREVVLGIDRDITERRQAENRIHESQVRLAEAQMMAKVGSWETDLVTLQVIWSDETYRIFELDANTFNGSHPAFLDFVHPEDRKKVDDAFYSSLEKDSYTAIEHRIVTSRGNIKFVEERWRIEPDAQGRPMRVVGTCQDITERKQADEALHKSEALYRQAIEVAGAVPYYESYYDNGRSITYEFIGDGIRQITGYGPEEFNAQVWDSLVEEVNLIEDLAGYSLNEGIQRVRNGEAPVWKCEHRIRDRAGEIHWVFEAAVELRDEHGVAYGSIGTYQDITKRKQAEEKLLEANERFKQLADNIQEVFWITDAITGEDLYISPAGEKIWGHSVKDLMQVPDTYINTILPEDRAMVLHTMEKQRSGQTTEIEYRIVHSDGSVHWVWDRAFPIFDEAGTVLRVAGIAMDITERKQIEAETRRHLAELEALYENGLAVGRLLEPREICERIIGTFEKHLDWHHVAIRLIDPETMEMKLIAFNQVGLNDKANRDAQHYLNSMISKVGQGLSGWVAQTGQPFRTGNVSAQTHYVATYMDINSGVYMPLKLGERCIGVISVESHEPDAFSEQDERLLATLASQAAIAFENARLYQSAQQELLERKRIETELRTSETHYRELADSITDIFFELDQNLHYSHWNTASEILTAVPEAEAIGKSMHEILVGSEDGARIENIYKSVLLNHQPRIFETLFNVNNGRRYFEVNAYPSMRGIAVIAKDVTERKRSETIMQKRFELMEYAARHSLEEIMEMTIAEVSNLTGSAFGFFHIMEADQTTPSLQIWSTNALSLFNVPVSEGRHRSVEQAGAWADAIRQRRTIIHNDYESLSNKKGIPAGHVPIIRDLVIPIIRNEKILAVMGIANKPQEYTQQDLEITERFVDYAWDITERKQMELALAEERNHLVMRVDERTADLSRANANLARALRVKDEFLANMSHELRTPLNAILGLSESLAEQTAGPLNEKQQRYITTVSESGHHLLSLINDILDLAKIEAGQIELDVQRVDIQSVCDASMRMIKQLARKKNQNTVVEINDKLGLMWADERRLKQMLVNLLSNAVKFTPEGGKLGLEVHGDQDENKVTFTVWDTGIGIKASDLPRLFQPFVQLDAGLARESSGTGLGLALVAQMARMHGGSTSVVSAPGKGSRFSIMLPWEPALAVDTVERLKITGKFKAVKFNKDRKPTILLIEDTEEVIMMLSDYLELNGFKTITARDGLEGITQAQLTHPDLILMDIQMPRMDGFETTKKLRSEPEFKTTPIIALTALAMPNDRERCLEAGMDEYITKPVHLRALVKIIELFLSGETEVKSP